MTPSDPLLTAENLALERGGRLLFEGVGFTLAAGSLLLLRGPNGAGKSSLLLTLAGVLRPSAGTISWPSEEPSLHLMLLSPGIKSRLTLGENLGFWRSMTGASGLAVEAALDAVGLGGLAGLDAGYLSAGQTRRLALARLLVSDRPVWLLDEPLASLDAAGDALVVRLIGEHRAGGGAVIAATHDDISGATETLTLGRAA